MASHPQVRIGVGICLAVLLIVIAPAPGQSASPPFPVIGRPAPDFALTSQTGREVRLSQFRGRLVLLNFIYTHCTDVCPLTTAALARVQRELIGRRWWGHDVVFISITTDPGRDTPAVLATYARRYRADPGGWFFLTGPARDLRRVYERYGIEVRPAARGLQEHALPTFVIDRRGIVLGAYGVNPDPRDVLSDLTKLR